MSRWAVVAPGERRIDHLAFRHVGSAVGSATGKIFTGMADLVAEQGVMPSQLAGNCLGVRIKEQLRPVKTQTSLRVIRAVDPVAVKKVGPRLGQIAMPDLISLRDQVDAFDFLAAQVIKETELNRLCTFGKDGEVDALAVPRGA